MIFNTIVDINDTHYNPCYFYFCTTLVRWKCYFILQKLTKLQSSEVFRSGKFPHCARDWAQRSSKTSMQYYSLRDGRDVDCIINNFYFYFFYILFYFYFVVIMSNFRLETSEESWNMWNFNLSILLNLFIFFFLKITHFNVYISKIHTN